MKPLLCCWAAVAQAAEPVLMLLRHGGDDLLARDGLPSLRSLQDVRPGPRHVRWLTSVDVLLASSR